MLKETNPVDVLAQPAPRLGGLAGLSTHNQSAAQPLFKQPDALRHGRRRHVQRACGALKATFSDHRSQCNEG